MHGWRWWAICSCDCRPGGIFCAPVSLSSLCASHSLTQKQLTHTHSHTRPPTVESALSTIINILFFLCTCHAATPLHADFESGWARSLSSEPRGLAGLSVPWHAGVLTRSKIGGSLLCGLSRPWHGLGSPQIFFACCGRLLIRIDPSHAQQSPPQHPPLPILVALLERNLQAKQFSQIASSSNKRMSQKPVYAGPL